VSGCSKSASVNVSGASMVGFAGIGS
jgi:hypothetical protein